MCVIRYHKCVSVSDLYKLKDVVEILDRGGAGRMVRLARGVSPIPTPSPELSMDIFLVRFVYYLPLLR